MFFAVLLLPACLAAPTNIATSSGFDCGNAAGEGCPDNICIPKGYIGHGKCTQVDGQWQWRPGQPSAPTAETHNCGEAAGDNCPEDMCIPKIYGRGTCSKTGNMWKWFNIGLAPADMAKASASGTGTASSSGQSLGGNGASKTQSPPRTTTAGTRRTTTAAPTDTRRTALTPPRSTAGTMRPAGAGQERNCGAAAGKNCPDFICASKLFGGKGECTETQNGWIYRSGPIPMPTAGVAVPVQIGS